MKKNTHSVDLTTQQLHLIKSALDTQEKILSVQSRAGQDDSAAQQLTDLQAVKKTVERFTPQPVQQQQSWSAKAQRWLGCPQSAQAAASTPERPTPPRIASLSQS